MYPYRTTYRKAEKTYVEDRGYLHELSELDDGFDEVHSFFKDMLEVGQTALRGAEQGEWEVVDGFTAEEALKESEASRLRSERDRLLSDTDYLLMPDYPLSEEKRSEVEGYRQALRDLPQVEGWPLYVVFPVKPSL